MSGMPGPPVMDSEMGSVSNRPIRIQGISSNQSWKMPRRYVVAVMCNLAFFIRGWIIANIAMIFYHLFVFSTAEDEPMHHMPTIANFTLKDGDDILVTSNAAFIVGQIPAAVLIVKFSPYKMVQISMMISSFLQLITPWTLNVSAALFIINIILQGMCACPLECAFIGIWREWGPSTEKTTLLMITFSGKFIYAQVAGLLCLFLSEYVSPVSIHYFAGIVGIIWCILWTCIISDSPVNDPLITESELQYLDERIPFENKEKITLKSVPLKSILTSLPVLSFCLVIISSAFSSRSILDFLLGFQVHLLVSESATNWMFSLLVINCIVLVPAAGALSDLLINRKIVETTTMRKILCVGGLVLQSFFLILIWIPDAVAGTICFIIAAVIFPYTLAGILPNVLDISPRYACIIMALAMTLHSISSLLYDYLLVYLISDWTNHEWAVAFIPVELIALLAAVIFFIFGSGEEQIWSSSPSTTLTSERNNDGDFHHYPQTDLEDEMLITAGL